MWALSLFPLLGNIIDKIFPDAESANKAKMELAKMEQEAMASQVEVNKVEAANSSIFVAGWRPCIGWVCALIFAYTYAIQPLLVFLLAIGGHIVAVPKLDVSDVMPVLLGMLGLGGLRTYEKTKGVAKK